MEQVLAPGGLGGIQERALAATAGGIHVVRSESFKGIRVPFSRRSFADLR
ncbi:hypothetical protein [Nonomuraea cavernae]|nr:hypothetical protein [Nonomuraea cavernae]MCA2185464.1 hypothetical protein [Nonomuraea cavernae]